MRLKNLSSDSHGDTQLNILITTGMVKRYLATWGVSKVQAVATGGNGYSGADRGSLFWWGEMKWEARVLEGLRGINDDMWECRGSRNEKTLSLAPNSLGGAKREVSWWQSWRKVQNWRSCATDRTEVVSEEGSLMTSSPGKNLNVTLLMVWEDEQHLTKRLQASRVLRREPVKRLRM